MGFKLWVAFCFLLSLSVTGLIIWALIEFIAFLGRN